MILRQTGEKIVLFFAVFMLCGIFPSLAQQTGIEFDDLIYDFGTINEVDGPVSHIFEYKNVGMVPYVIEFVSVSCGCTTPEYDKSPLMPGKKGKITITFDPSGRPGVFNKSIVVTGNNRKDRINLNIMGTVVGRLRTPEENYPISLAAGLRTNLNSFLFGYIGRGTSKTETIELYNAGNETVSVTINTKTNLPQNTYSVKVLPETIKPKEKGQLIFTYDLTQADVWGLVSTSVSMIINGKRSAEDFTAYATVTEDFTKWTPQQKDRAPSAEFSSQFYHFNEMRKGDRAEHEFLVVNRGEDPLILRNIKPNSSKITCTASRTELKKGESAVLTVAMEASEPGRMSESVTIILNDPARPMREIRLAATVK